MSISKALSIQLLNISQNVLSSIEDLRLDNAKSAICRLAAVVVTHTDRSDEVARWTVEEDC